ncbi:MAG: hypothetical protein GF331_02210 [Chitinivibrionales bacterium]|nr:hypothetical protein [Chitinivibrionales bacterium]
MNDEIIAYLREHPDGVSSRDVAEQFLKFKAPDERLAHVAVNGILGKDRRAELGDDGLWRAREEAAPSRTAALAELPWAAVAVLNDLRRIVHVSAWSVLPEPQQLVAEWLVDPATLSTEDQQKLRSPADAPFDASRRDDVLAGLAAGLSERLPVFVCAREEALLNWHGKLSGVTLTDDTVLISSLFRAAELDVPRPLDLETCYQALFGRRPFATTPAQRGRLLAECTAELLTTLARLGVETRAQLEQRLEREVEAFDFSGKQFDHETLATLTGGPGVYGFKDKAGTYIYIGKANNVRRRVSGYFRRTDESPTKLERLRTEAATLTVHPCGSELESLLLEHRLIAKYSPRLNTQAQINERKGTWRSIEDCAVLLPHAEEGMGMSVWFRDGQKIRLRAFHTDFREIDDLSDELESFFFSERLEAAQTDFPEQEIASRWLRRHMDSLVTVPAYRKANGREVAEAMQVAWREECEGRFA